MLAPSTLRRISSVRKMPITRKQKQGGYMIVRNADDRGHDIECDTFTCRHCNRIVKIRPLCDPVELGGRCTGCDGLLCSACASNLVCIHIEKRVELIERRAALAQALRG